MKPKTVMTKKGEVRRRWYLVDAKDKILGRFAGRVARVLIGKHKPSYTPSVDGGDGIIIVNASRIRLTGKKVQQKDYTRYTGYPGGLRVTTFQELMAKKPELIVKHAVKGMLPKNKLGTGMFKRLKVYAGEDHRDSNLNPERLAI